ncbi:transcription initiation factor IIB [Halosegnis rubeus]|jgi:transcription initiation factor TFIIB|uniref:Transcription initiation factor IIB n=1 Tax=Halosegnis rubeus TaxID=2212850 RepID=A0A5N5UEG6_9EURY|nr:transcription initiation factor IIB [Halosegnis rubeus]KAB7515670.1 transcription initiation factor IIB [Halosegnis rubeus]KAB7517124.1 transcription initiation factor IIB [Halosegnis rubeus]
MTRISKGQDRTDAQTDDVDPENLVRTANGELMDEETGLIVDEDNIDHGPEWRAFSHQEQQQKSRVGAPTTRTMHDKGLTTNIDWQNKDASGHTLSQEKRSQMQRLRTWQERIRTQESGERNLQFALSEIDRMASALGVPRSIREVASVIYRQALDRDLIRGRSIEGVATASLHAACRQESIPRSLDDITEVSRVERREIGRTYRYISQELELALEPVDPKSYLPQLASKLETSDEVQQEAARIVEKTTELGLHSGKSPSGYAAAALYAASRIVGPKLTQRAVADVADVTVVTIRNRYQEQMDALDVSITH